MSIIVTRFSDSKIFNFLKGADQAMFSKQSKTPELVESLPFKQHVNEFAETGLRVLVFGMVDMSRSTPSIKSIKESPSEDFDKNIEIIGATGLQDVL